VHVCTFVHECLYVTKGVCMHFACQWYVQVYLPLWVPVVTYDLYLATAAVESVPPAKRRKSEL